MAQLYDLNRGAFDRVLDIVVVEQACNTAVDETLQLAAAQVPAPAPQDNGHYDRVLVLEYLLQLHEAVRLQVEQRAQEMPPLAWLWCLRRMPRDVVHGPLPQSHAVLQQMAEVMGCHSHMGQAGV